MKQQLSEARVRDRKKRINYERVRVVIAQVKEMMRSESDRTVKRVLAQAGLELNKILLK